MTNLRLCCRSIRPSTLRHTQGRPECGREAEILPAAGGPQWNGALAVEPFRRSLPTSSVPCSLFVIRLFRPPSFAASFRWLGFLPCRLPFPPFPVVLCVLGGLCGKTFAVQSKILPVCGGRKSKIENAAGRAALRVGSRICCVGPRWPYNRRERTGFGWHRASDKRPWETFG